MSDRDVPPYIAGGGNAGGPPGGRDRNELAKLLERAEHAWLTMSGVDETSAEHRREKMASAVLAAGYRRVSADPDTVERVADTFREEMLDANPDLAALRIDEWLRAARAAINAIGGGQ